MYLDFSLNDITPEFFDDIKKVIPHTVGDYSPVPESESAKECNDMRLFDSDYTCSAPYRDSMLYIDEYYDENDENFHLLATTYGSTITLGKYKIKGEAVAALKRCQEKYEEGCTSWVVGG